MPGVRRAGVGTGGKRDDRWFGGVFSYGLESMKWQVLAKRVKLVVSFFKEFFTEIPKFGCRKQR